LKELKDRGSDKSRIYVKFIEEINNLEVRGL
jgi:hypothetical protein